jgi:DNA polymerase-1
MEDNLASQIPKVFEILDAFGIKSIVVDGYEADDVIGTMATRFANAENQAIVVSNDRDMWQLVNKNVLIMVPTTTGKAEWIGSEEVKKRMGLEPSQVPDYKGLKGDPSDNIPGVHGIGDKTALKLIQEFGSIEEMYRNINKVEPKSVQEKLAHNAEEAVMSKHLATIIPDVPVTVNLQDCAYDNFNKEKVKEVLEKYHFRSLLKRLGFEVEDGKKPDIPENQMELFK